MKLSFRCQSCGVAYDSRDVLDQDRVCVSCRPYELRAGERGTVRVLPRISREALEDLKAVHGIDMEAALREYDIDQRPEVYTVTDPAFDISPEKEPEPKPKPEPKRKLKVIGTPFGEIGGRQITV